MLIPLRPTRAWSSRRKQARIDSRAGAREDEEDRLRRFLSGFAVRPVTERIAEIGGRYRGSWGPSHGTGLADALVAATASAAGCTLATFNDRPFPMLDAVEVPYER